MALAAPQIAGLVDTRVTADPGVVAGVLLVSDVIAQRIIAPSQLPVGIVTAVSAACT